MVFKHFGTNLGTIPKKQKHWLKAKKGETDKKCYLCNIIFTGYVKIIFNIWKQWNNVDGSM